MKESRDKMRGIDAEDKGERRKQAEAMRAEQRERIAEMLTPEQRKRYEEMMAASRPGSGRQVTSGRVWVPERRRQAQRSERAHRSHGRNLQRARERRVAGRRRRSSSGRERCGARRSLRITQKGGPRFAVLIHDDPFSIMAEPLIVTRD